MMMVHMLDRPGHLRAEGIPFYLSLYGSPTLVRCTCVKLLSLILKSPLGASPVLVYVAIIAALRRPRDYCEVKHSLVQAASS